jgi:hypothetical protein
MSCNRCDACSGTGKVLGLGCMRRECYKCAGVGYVAIEKEIEDKPNSVKRTRKPRGVSKCPKKENRLSGDQQSIMKN